MKRLLSVLIVAIIIGGVFVVDKMWILPKADLVVLSSDVYQATNCRLSPGERAAFRLNSTVTAQGQSDRFDSTMSWEVVALNEGVARVRAAFSSVAFTQELSLPSERASSPEGLPFFLEIDSKCAVVTKAFSSKWDVKTRLLVSTQIENYAFVLPETGQRTWEVKAFDGMGSYTANFTRVDQPSLLIRREKSHHLSKRGAESFGISISLDNARAQANFDEALPMWWQSVSGQEHVTVRAPGQPEVTMIQHYSLERDDAQFVSVPMLKWDDPDVSIAKNSASDYRSSQPKSSEFSVLKNKHQSYSGARAAFNQAISETPPLYFDAALELAGWLKENPADVGILIAELYGDLDEESRPTVFHALQLSGTSEAKKALIEIIDERALSDIDQARAVSALADLDEPSQEVVDVLLDRAKTDDTAGKVSILAVGTMASRADNTALRQHMLTALNDRHSAASYTSERLVLLDAMGNTKDERFLELLNDELGSSTHDIRRHAALALSKLPAEMAKPVLFSRLMEEQDPRVSTTLIKALKKTGAASVELTAALDQLLTQSRDNQRTAIVDLLGAQSSNDARQLLAKQFKREKNVHIKQRIGRYLPAEALR